MPALCEQPSLPLYNAAQPGMTMSASGLGTGGPGCYNASADGKASLNASLTWLALGGRRFDGAISYGCDAGIGAAIVEAGKAGSPGLARADVFVTSKIGPGGLPYALGYNETLAQAERILQDLQSPYVDLLLVHEPFSYWPSPAAAGRAPSSDPACAVGGPLYNATACRLSTWRAMVFLWRAGKARAIGVSNFNSSHILEFAAAGLPLPAVNQVEFSPLHQGRGGGGCNCGRSSSRPSPSCGRSPAEDREDCAALQAFLRQHRIVFNGYSPFGGGGNATTALLSDPTLEAIGHRHNATAAQVILNWQWSKGVAVNPQARAERYQSENLHFLAFQLSPAEVAVLDGYGQ
jgi:diketogulonate reductase-like aldo/keto reductase